MKNLARALPLLVLVVLLLAVRLGSCSLFPTLPTTASGTSGLETTGQTTGDTTAPTTTAATATTAVTTATTAAPTTAEPTTAEPTTAEPTTTATTSTSPTTTAPTTTTPDPARLDNTKTGWWYTAPNPLNQDLPATLPAAVSRLVSRYDVIWQKPLAGRKVVYLTMDEGYEFGDNTTKILNTAKLKGVPITFFITGSYLQKNPAKVQRMAEEGHLVANHTVNHANLVDLAQSGKTALFKELRDLETAYRNLTGEDMAKIVRPPEGSYSERVLAYLTEAGYRTAFWSFAYRDWLTDDQPDPDRARSTILGQLHDGSVILLHAVSNTNVAILPDLIDEIRDRGYDFALLGEAR